MISGVEWVGFIFGVVYVLLAARDIVWCWPVGIISSIFYIYFNIDKHFYQDAILQTYYVVAGFYGWWLWKRGKVNPDSEFVSYSFVKNLRVILFGAVLVPLFGFVFSKYGNSLSYLDAAVTVFSFIATWMTARKILENWLFWVIIDLVASIMYAVKGSYLTAGLYIFYVPMAMYGYYAWRKQMKLA